MSKRKGRKALSSPTPATQGQDFEAFSFGEPSPVLDKREILDYIECTGNGKWYEPPISFDGLARSVRAAVHHSSPMFVKRNILASTFIPHPMLSQQEFSRYALDYLVFGNAFLEVRKNQLGKPLRLQCSPAKYTRRGLNRIPIGLCKTGKSLIGLRQAAYST
jgi:capsid portal protein